MKLGTETPKVVNIQQGLLGKDRVQDQGLHHPLKEPTRLPECNTP